MAAGRSEGTLGYMGRADYELSPSAPPVRKGCLLYEFDSGWNRLISCISIPCLFLVLVWCMDVPGSFGTCFSATLTLAVQPSAGEDSLMSTFLSKDFLWQFCWKMFSDLFTQKSLKIFLLCLWIKFDGMEWSLSALQGLLCRSRWKWRKTL